MTENRRRWLLISLAVGAVVVVIALITWLLSSSGGANKAAGVPAPSLSPSPSASATPKPHHKPTVKPSSSTVRIDGVTFGEAPGWGTGYSDTPHHLVLQVFSDSRVFAYLGWIVPTAASGKGKSTMYSSGWSRSYTVYGRPNYAIFYVQYGPSSGAVTCRITVDGRVRVEKTSTGRYGGVMCIG